MYSSLLLLFLRWAVPFFVIHHICGFTQKSLHWLSEYFLLWDDRGQIFWGKRSCEKNLSVRGFQLNSGKKKNQLSPTCRGVRWREFEALAWPVCGHWGAPSRDGHWVLSTQLLSVHGFYKPLFLNQKWEKHSFLWRHLGICSVPLGKHHAFFWDNEGGKKILWPGTWTNEWKTLPDVGWLGWRKMVQISGYKLIRK